MFYTSNYTTFIYQLYLNAAEKILTLPLVILLSYINHLTPKPQFPHLLTIVIKNIHNKIVMSIKLYTWNILGTQ